MKDEKQIIIVLGYPCSGKSHLAKQILDTCKHSMTISTSTVLKDIKKGININKRSETKQTNYLDEDILKRLVSVIDSYKCTAVVIDGIRPPLVLDGILDKYENVLIYWMNTPYEIRRERYEARATQRPDDISLLEADEIDNHLGLAELYEKHSSKFYIVN